MFASLAILCAGLFSGAAGYISLVEHWARLHAGPAVALAQFRPGFPRARALQSSLALVGALSAVATWITGGGTSWLVVALLLAGVVIFTLVWITPLYQALLDPALAADDPAATALLKRWGRLHHARSLAGLAALLVALASR